MIFYLIPRIQKSERIRILMMPIDKFINQLIQLGLADSFLEVINSHYLKVIEVYNIISFIDEDNIEKPFDTSEYKLEKQDGEFFFIKDI